MNKMETVRREGKMCLALIKWSAVRWQTWTICGPDESCHFLQPRQLYSSPHHHLLFFIFCLPSPTLFTLHLFALVMWKASDKNFHLAAWFFFTHVHLCFLVDCGSPGTGASFPLPRWDGQSFPQDAPRPSGRSLHSGYHLTQLLHQPALRVQPLPQA